jgi:hypothetical protein
MFVYLKAVDDYIQERMFGTQSPVGAEHLTFRSYGACVLQNFVGYKHFASHEAEKLPLSISKHALNN